jgi:hypothetical protein
MQTDVIWSCAAISIAIKSGHRIAATAPQVSPENICGHAAQ